MKIALVVPGFSAHERDWCIPALLDYVRALAMRDEVHVFTLRWPERQDRYRVFGADVRALGGRARLGARVTGLWARALGALLVEHRRGPFDVIHAFWVDEPGWVATLAGVLVRRPVVLSLAGGELVRLPDIGYGLQLLPGRRALVGWQLARASLVTAGSDYMLNLARPLMPTARLARLRRAPLGVDLTRFRPESKAAENGAVVGINVGALYPVKDQAHLLRAAARVPGLRVRIAGQGPLRAGLAALADGLGLADRVDWLGAVPHDVLPAVYSNATVFAQTSRHEAQGMAVVEAAARGVLAVGTPVGVLPEIGLPAANEAALAQTLGALAEDAPRRRRLGEAARQSVEGEFSLETAMRRFRALYDEMAEGGL